MNSELVLSKRNIKWLKFYELAKIYYNHHGDLNIMARFKTINGYEEDEMGENLGEWLRNQRRFYQKGNLSQERIKLLEEIGACLDNKREVEWLKHYELAKIYFEKYGNLDVENSFKTINGIDYAEDGFGLGKWLSLLRIMINKGILDEEKKILVQKIGIDTKKSLDDEWNRKYNLAKNYYIHYGDLDVPRDFVTVKGYEFNDIDKDAVALGRWIHTQRETFKKGKLSEERIKLLEEIGMKFILFDRDDNWRKNYELVKIFYNYNGHLNIPAYFKTLNGYEYDEKGYSLGIWFNKQRMYYTKGKMFQERLELFQHICDFETTNPLLMTSYLTWNGFYELAKKYYEHHGNLKIPDSFYTVNGYEEDANGHALGNWISTQRKAFNNNTLKDDRYYKLSNIGMIWNVKRNKENNIQFCLWLNINPNENLDIIRKMSFPEFISKTKYLIYNNIPIQVNGKLHEIFHFSVYDLHLKYDLTLEKLLSEFYFPKEICKSRTLNK